MKKIRKVIPMLASSPLYGMAKCGEFNGYIAIPHEIYVKIKSHQNWHEIPDIGVYPHGDWTYMKRYKDLAESDNFIPLLDIRKVDTTNYYIIGFDTAHFGDDSNKWNAKTVREHTFELYDAMIKYIKNNSR